MFKYIEAIFNSKAYCITAIIVAMLFILAAIVEGDWSFVTAFFIGLGTMSCISTLAESK